MKQELEYTFDPFWGKTAGCATDGSDLCDWWFSRTGFPIHTVYLRSASSETHLLIDLNSKD